MDYNEWAPIKKTLDSLTREQLKEFCEFYKIQLEMHGLADVLEVRQRPKDDYIKAIKASYEMSVLTGTTKKRIMDFVAHHQPEPAKTQASADGGQKTAVGPTVIFNAPVHGPVGIGDHFTQYQSNVLNEDIDRQLREIKSSIDTLKLDVQLKERMGQNIELVEKETKKKNPNKELLDIVLDETTKLAGLAKNGASIINAVVAIKTMLGL